MFISLEYKLDPDEFARATTAAFRREFWVNLVVTVFLGLILSAVIVAGIAKPPLDLTLTAYMGACFLWLLYRLCSRRARLRRAYRKRNIIRMNVTFAEEGASWHMTSQSGEHRSDEGWNAYVRIEETPAFFLLYRNRKQAMLVPKRAFPPEQAALFSRFVEQEFPQARLADRSEPAHQG
jgi:hypothetical protein